jgi:hypothetical protein
MIRQKKTRHYRSAAFEQYCHCSEALVQKFAERGKCSQILSERHSVMTDRCFVESITIQYKQELLILCIEVGTYIVENNHRVDNQISTDHLVVSLLSIRVLESMVYTQLVCQRYYKQSFDCMNWTPGSHSQNRLTSCESSLLQTS